MKEKSKLSLAQKIREDWGSMPFFCKKNGLNYHTFRQVVYGYKKSARIVEILKQHKYIKSADELRKVG